jgi:hypothetical protein
MLLLLSWRQNGPGKRLVIKDNDLVIKMSLKNLYIYSERLKLLLCMLHTINSTIEIKQLISLQTHQSPS